MEVRLAKSAGFCFGVKRAMEIVIETAEKNGLKSIGCGYGYGSPEELSAADIIVSDIMEIPDAVKKLLS